MACELCIAKGMDTFMPVTSFIPPKTPIKCMTLRLAYSRLENSIRTHVVWLGYKTVQDEDGGACVEGTTDTSG